MRTTTLTPEERFARYMENNKRANKKYLETHRELVNKRRNDYYHAHLANNEDFLQRRRDYAKMYYLKKKEKQATENETTATAEIEL